MTIDSVGMARDVVSALFAAGGSNTRTGTGNAVASAVGAPTSGSLRPAAPAFGVDELKAKASEWQSKLADVAQDIRFSVDEASGRPLIRVIDVSTAEVIRQIPSEEVLAIGKAIDAFQKRLMPDQEA
jgi:flagellar protein FlaG